MAIETTTVDYRDGATTLRATVTRDTAHGGPRPGVLVSHAWRGRTPFEDDKARALAELGYVGFALDLYGAGITGSSPEENRRLMQPLLDDRPGLRRRMQLALKELRRSPGVDRERTAAIGFCFGGLCVLDLARSGADVRGVASFHGLLDTPDDDGGPVTAKVLALHGWEDPMVPPASVTAWTREMSDRGADWQLHAYGNTLHAFTNPAANDAANGLEYAPQADRRSWQALQYFLAEIFEETDR